MLLTPLQNLESQSPGLYEGKAEGCGYKYWILSQTASKQALILLGYVGMAKLLNFSVPQLPH